MLDRLPPSLQYMLMLEWLSPESVCALARTTGVLRRAVLSAPLPFSAGDTVVADACARWFQKHGVPLRLWVRVITNTWYEVHYCNGKMHRDGDKPAVITEYGTRYWYKHDKLHRDGDLPAVDNGVVGMREWWKHGLRHRDGNKPAVQNGKFRFQWWQDGQRIR